MPVGGLWWADWRTIVQDPRFEIVDDERGFHARYIAGSQIIWWTESYTRKENARHAVALIAGGAIAAPLYDLTASARRAA